MSKAPSNAEKLPAFTSDGDLAALIETPRGSRNKYKYDSETERFMLSGVLPAGAVFPFDFGCVPSTRGDDGDPLDVLVLMDEAAFPGCLVPTRLIGMIEAVQREEDGETARNDRLIAVAASSRNHAHVKCLEDLNENLLAEIEHFFVSYNSVRGREFKPSGRKGPDEAVQLVKQRRHP